MSIAYFFFFLSWKLITNPTLILSLGIIVFSIGRTLGGQVFHLLAEATASHREVVWTWTRGPLGRALRVLEMLLHFVYVTLLGRLWAGKHSPDSLLKT